MKNDQAQVAELLGVNPRMCEHCGLAFAPEDVTPVKIDGASTYNGHLMIREGWSQDAYLCTLTCLPIMRDAAATISGMNVKVDAARVRARGPLPSMRSLTADEREEAIPSRCTGVGSCSDDQGNQGNQDATITHVVTDGSGREWPFCHGHAERAYLFELRRWRDRQAHVA